ncbi:MAG: hypothetical protein IKZ19_07495, partial [Clostridia bacterium]|nr:hypothetical protein [Clostridia bacterium]
MLPIPHFPTAYQCVIFRNWGLVPVSKIAEVIETDSDTVRLAAVEMGLDPDPEVLDAWLTKGYITVIRANWHILDYPALCKLLDWTPEK